MLGTTFESSPQTRWEGVEEKPIEAPIHYLLSGTVLPESRYRPWPSCLYILTSLYHGKFLLLRGASDRSVSPFSIIIAAPMSRKISLGALLPMSFDFNSDHA